jgi:hypothetical protein
LEQEERDSAYARELQAQLGPPATVRLVGLVDDASVATGSGDPGLASGPPEDFLEDCRDEEEDDLQFAQQLQALELAAARAAEQAVLEADRLLAIRLQTMDSGAAGGQAATGEAAVDDTSQDEALAVLLQQQFNSEHDARVLEQELKANNFSSTSKISVSMDRHRSAYPSDAPHQRGMDEEEEDALEAQLWEDEIEEATHYHRGTRTMRNATGTIVTKHDPLISGRRNRQRVEETFPLGFARWCRLGGRKCVFFGGFFRRAPPPDGQLQLLTPLPFLSTRVRLRLLRSPCLLPWCAAVGT